jgi:hypothetical protein
VVALEMVRALAASERFEVMEPGRVREQLLSYRIILEGGVSFDTARVVAGMLDVNLVVSGYVREFNDAGVPKVEFTVLVLEKRTEELVWQSTSYNTGADGVWFFGLGQVSTASALTCRMMRNVVEGMAGMRRATRALPEAIRAGPVAK